MQDVLKKDNICTSLHFWQVNGMIRKIYNKSYSNNRLSKKLSKKITKQARLVQNVFKLYQLCVDGEVKFETI